MSEIVPNQEEEALKFRNSQFEPEGPDKHSSSIVDLIDSCKSATDFIIKLKWPDEYENARYLTGLSQVIFSLFI